MDNEIVSACKVAVYRECCSLGLGWAIPLLMRSLSKVDEKIMMSEAIKTFEQAVDQVLSELRAVMIAKQRDYGSRNILDCGETGVLIRANDKLARLRNLYGITDGSYKRKEISNESLEDSWVDLANYAIIALMLRKGIFNRPLSHEPQGKSFNVQEAS